MRKVVATFVAVMALFIIGSRPLAAEEIAITVSPKVINIASASTVVTVHTDIDYDLVVGASVKLNGIDIDWWKDDNRGNFVAKFNADEVKGIVEPGSTATLTLTGETVLGDSFSGVDQVDVIEVKKRR